MIPISLIRLVQRGKDMKRFSLVLLIFALFFVIVSHVRAEDTAKEDNEIKKVYAISLKTMGAGYTIKDLEEVDFKEIAFIKGVDVDSRSWTIDKTIYIPKEESILINR